MIKIYLTGGLGNQLFQYSALKYFGQNQVKICDLSFGNFNRSSLTLNSIIQNPNIEFREITNKNYLAKKTLNFLLRLSTKKKSNQYINLIEKMAKTFLNIIMRKRQIISVANGVGFDKLNASKIGDQILVGYFQSYIYASHSKIENDLKPCSFTGNGLDLYNKIRKERPTILHVRANDYFQNPDFGQLSKEYYEESLDYLKRRGINNRIWIFSDDNEYAMRLLSSSKYSNQFFFCPTGNSTHEIFEIMRHGSSYIIANSTFSWWAAFLRYDRKGKTICPRKWYKNMNDPDNLIPPTWIPMNSQWL